ncbi:phage tail protein [Haemophilus influenzae]|uniref:Phage tail protein n=1 Tax=Haemophilus influenzae TaxID=727 RepID=A0A2S9S800_HAEIF|nr:phage tail protein [Haemophilus influenzae]DAO37255.1 MAG TPA: Baseplate wedge protein [Caudoviricetes sp.]AXP38806.1 phage tail protein [Haemophilus influenzae]MCK8899820.1 phage tail protein [Haemophilus influenzae]MCK8905995.1 phage tail protein [Haemophilus influenzae]MCK8943825.1 phage tail protein [Haemophilus influenzae]
MKTLLPEIDSPDKRFHAGNPATGEQGTRVTDTWLNDVQDHVRDVQAEAHYVLLKAGFKPVENQQTQLYDAIVKIIDDNRQKASTTGKGEVQLYSGYDSDSEEMAATPKAIKLLKAFIDALTRNLTNYIPNSKKSSDVNSASADTVATSAAVKKAYDKAESKWTAQAATETTAGILPISHKTDGTDKNKFASEYAVGEAAKKGVPIGAVVSFPRAVTNPVGFLRADGSTFSQQTFPDLYRTLGDSNQLPDLTRSDVGMTAYFAVDNIPSGWIAFDEIATQVTEQRYPELYRHLVGKYGSIARVPKVADRFLRNVGNGLSVGQIQEDDLKRHVHRVPIDYDSWFDDSSQGRNNSYFDYTTFTHSSDLWSVNYYDDRDGDNGFVSPKNTSQMATGGDETRPKSLVLKLCIKALNSFDDVVFWIKSHGEVTNAGALDAGRLAQGLQDKAERNHTHTVSQITDFNQSVREIVTQSITQNLAETGWCKLPNGMILQWGLAVLNSGYGRTTDTYITFPIRFPASCFNVVMSYGVMTDKRVTQDPVLASLDQTGMTVRQQSDRDVVIYWRAIGV